MKHIDLFVNDLTEDMCTHRYICMSFTPSSKKLINLSPRVRAQIYRTKNYTEDNYKKK